MVALFLVLLSGITIPVGFLAGYLGSAAGQILNREVTIDGPILLTTSLHPEIAVEGLTIANPRSWPADASFADIERARIKISVIALLGGDIQIDDLEIGGAAIRMVTRSDGVTNTQFVFATDDQGPGYQWTGIDNLHLRKAHVSYLDEHGRKTYELTIDDAYGRGAMKAPFTLSARGKLLGKPYSISLKGDPLPDLARGSKAWALASAQLRIADAELNVTGTLDSTETPGARLNASLAGTDLKPLGEMFAIALPMTDRFSGRSEIDVSPGVLRINGLEIEMLGSTLKASVTYTYTGERPDLRGEIDVPELDPALFLALGNPTATDGAKDDGGGSSPASLPWKLFKVLDAELGLRIGEVKLDAFSAHDLHTALTLSDGNLTLPFSLEIDGAPASGQLEIQTRSKEPSIALAFTSASMPAAPLAKTVLGDERYAGQIGAAKFEGETHGRTRAELLRNLGLSLRITDTHLQADTGTLLATSSLTLEREAGNPYELSAQGGFLGRPLRIKARAGRTAKSTEGASISLDLDACDTNLTLDALTRPIRDSAAINFKFSVRGARLCGFLGPVERFVGSAARFSALGSGKLDANGWMVDLKSAKVGDIAVDATATLQAGARNPPLIQGSIHSRRLDLGPFLAGDKAGQMQATRPSAQRPSPANKGGASRGRHQELSADQKRMLLKTLLTHRLFARQRLLASDAIFRIHVEELDTGRGRASGIKMSAEIRDGALARAPFQVTVADETFSGNARIDLTGDVPTIRFELASRDFHLPALFRELQLSNPPDLNAEQIAGFVQFKGWTIQEMLQGSSYELSIRGGEWLIQRTSGDALRVEIEHGNYRSVPSEPARIELTGMVDSRPLTVDLTEDGFFAKGTSRPITLAMRTKLSDTKLEIDGRIVRGPGGSKEEFHLHTKLQGDRLDALDDLVQLDLPPLGPYRIEGSLQIMHGKASFHDMLLQVGESVLKGEVVLLAHERKDGKLVYPLPLTVRLDAETIQLDDFQFGNWSPVSDTKSSVTSEAAETPEPMVKREQASGSLKGIISARVAELFNATLEIKVRKVLSGTDKLGSGVLDASLENGVYSLDTLQLELPGGAIRMAGSMRPGVASTTARLGMQVDRFDYGVLARRFRADSNLKGEVNLDLALRSEAPSPAAIRQHLNGSVKFSVVPEEFQAGVIDLWAVNIVAAALPVVMKGNESTVNCLVGDFTVADGLMQPRTFLLDTSRIRVEGMGQVNLKTGAIDFLLRPTPKSPQFFSLATPVKIGGTINAPDIRVSTASILGTAFRMISGMVTTPFQKIFSSGISSEGCAAG